MANDITSKIYESVEIASKTGKIKKGSNEVTKSIERGAAKLVVVAEDTNPPEVIMHMEPLCKEKETPFAKVPSREELGAAVGLNVPTAAVAIVDAGNAADLLKEIRKKPKKEEAKQAVEPKAEKKEEPKKAKAKAEPKKAEKKKE
tara:strand:- start:67 stop:501 length:435 start_codon:yes stop_codon:yes gene_type:complete